MMSVQWKSNYFEAIDPVEARKILDEELYGLERVKQRIMEKTLFLVSVLGGSIGTWAGMYTFHHKTKHWYFVVGMPSSSSLLPSSS